MDGPKFRLRLFLNRQHPLGFKVAYRFAFLFKCVLSHSQSFVVDPPTKLKLLIQLGCLSFCWLESIPKHFSHYDVIKRSRLISLLVYKYGLYPADELAGISPASVLKKISLSYFIMQAS